MKDATVYFRTLRKIFDDVCVTNSKRKVCKFDEGIVNAIQIIIDQSELGGKLFFIGNGGSASIASHIAVDFCKNVGFRAFAFNDSSLLTCISNDYGYKYVFEKPMELLANTGDVLCAISSSGESENIIRAVKTARKRGLKIITFSGFYKDNQLRKLGDINFFVPAPHYGFVEIAHTALCHCLVDMTKKYLRKKC